MSAIARNTAGENQFEVLGEGRDVAVELSTSAPVASSASSSTPVSSRVKADIAAAVDCFDNTTKKVKCNVHFGEMRVLLREVFTMWSSDWLMQHMEDELFAQCKKPHEKLENDRKKARQDRRIAFISRCLAEIADVMVTMQKVLPNAQLMQFADSPLLVFKEVKRIPTENYRIYDVDFIKVYTVLQNRVRTYTKGCMKKFIKSLPQSQQAKTIKIIESLRDRMQGINDGLCDQLDEMNQLRIEERKARIAEKEMFFAKKAEDIKKRALAKKEENREEIERQLRGNWVQSSGPASKHSAHQDEIRMKQEKRAKEKAVKAKKADDAKKAQKASAQVENA